MERWGAIVLVALAVFLACLLQFYFLNFNLFDYLDNHDPLAGSLIGQSLWALIPNFFLATTKKCASRRFTANKRLRPIRNTKDMGKISIFTGRGAKKNHAIFEILIANGPLSIREIQKLLNKYYGIEITYYASLNKRIHALERDGYVAQIRQVDPSPRGSKAALYEACEKFYLARLLNVNSREEILSVLTGSHPGIVFADLVNAGVKIS